MPLDMAAANTHLVTSDLEALSRSTDLIEKGVGRELERLEEKAQPIQGQDSLDEADQEYLDYLGEHRQEIEEARATDLRAGVLLSMFSTLERYLVRLCQAYAMQRCELAAAEDLCRRFGLDRARRFLKNQVGIAFPDQGREWRELKTAQKIRNVFAHNRGWLSRSKVDGAVGRYIKSQPNLLLRGGQQVVIQEGYLDHLIKVAKVFVGDLESELEPAAA